MKRPLRTAPYVAGALLLSFVLGGSVPAWAQLVGEPMALNVNVLPGESAERVVSLTNTGPEAVSFCLSFERPLQRVAAAARLSPEAVGEACGEIGEVLLEQTSGFVGSLFGLTTTPEGRLFAADNSRTYELTPELEVVRLFEHPTVAEFVTFPYTGGVTHNSDTNTLWWLNLEVRGINPRILYRALLLEGDLDGNATGRRIELPIYRAEGDTLYPDGLSYNPATARYYMVVGLFERPFVAAPSQLWAVDTLGAVLPDYPVPFEPYPDVTGIRGLDAHGGAGGHPEAVRVELGYIPPDGGFERLLIVGPEGENLGIPETPLPDLSGGTLAGGIDGETLRSRVDPNGVLYFPFANFDANGIVGIRPQPLPPSWLALSRWDGTLEPGKSVEITLTFSAGTRELGSSYTSTLQVFEAATGTVLEVPLTFEVAPETAAEDGVELPAEASLAVFPNPAAGQTVVRVEVPERGELRVEVFDVLGRRVAALADGPVESGRHRFTVEAARLPAGVYVVRAESGAFAASQRLTVIR